MAVAGTGITAGLMQLKKNSQKTVSVTSVSGLLQDYYTPNTTIDGTVSSSATQTVTGDKDLIIDQVYVAKGDAVKKDDPLITWRIIFLSQKIRGTSVTITSGTRGGAGEGVRPDRGRRVISKDRIIR